MNLQDFYLFSNLDPTTTQSISKKVKKRKYKRGNIIFYRGDSSDNIHMLVDGTVKLYKYNSVNEEIVLHYLSSQSLIGEMATFEGIPYPANCMAENDVEIYSISKDDLLLSLKDNPNIAIDIIASLSKKIKILERSIDLNISKNSTQRVVTLILQNKNIFEELSRVKIASMLNMKQETLSRVIKKLKDSDFIKIEKKSIHITNKKALDEILAQ